MRDETITAFLDQLAARVPAPGGGATAALHAAQSAALLAMVARYSNAAKYDADLMDHVITYGSGGGVTSDTTEAKNAGWLSVGDMNGNPNVAVASKGYDVPGGTVTNNVNAEGSMTLTWTAMAAKRPPDTDPCPDAVDPSSPPICVAPGR